MIALACGTAPPARADDLKPLRYRIVNVPNSPIEIRQCAPYWSDYYSMVSVSETVSFTNRALETVTAVRFRFDFSNTFGESMGTQYSIKEGQYSSNVPIENTTHGQLVPYPAPSVVSCSVDTVKFRSGRTWERGKGPVAMSGSVGTGSGGGTGAAVHPATCQVMLADGREIAIPWENEGCATARRAYVPRTPPATCKVTLADKSQIEIPWNNEGCAAARQAWAANDAARRVTYDYDGEKTDGHPFTCTVLESTGPKDYAWSSEACAPARAQYASEPDWMHVRLWDSHDSAPENLVEGHPKFCDPYRSGILKDVHPLWSSPACRGARIKWDVIYGGAPPPTK